MSAAEDFVEMMAAEERQERAALLLQVSAQLAAGMLANPALFELQAKAEGGVEPGLHAIADMSVKMAVLLVGAVHNEVHQ